jgi:hypothetical protein
MYVQAGSLASPHSTLCAPWPLFCHPLCAPPHEATAAPPHTVVSKKSLMSSSDMGTTVRKQQQPRRTVVRRRHLCEEVVAVVAGTVPAAKAESKNPPLRTTNTAVSTKTKLARNRRVLLEAHNRVPPDCPNRHDDDDNGDSSLADTAQKPGRKATTNKSSSSSSSQSSSSRPQQRRPDNSAPVITRQKRRGGGGGGNDDSTVQRRSTTTSSSSSSSNSSGKDSASSFQSIDHERNVAAVAQIMALFRETVPRIIASERAQQDPPNNRTPPSQSLFPTNFEALIPAIVSHSHALYSSSSSSSSCSSSSGTGTVTNNTDSPTLLDQTDRNSLAGHESALLTLCKSLLQQQQPPTAAAAAIPAADCTVQPPDGVLHNADDTWDDDVDRLYVAIHTLCAVVQLYATRTAAASTTGTSSSSSSSPPWHNDESKWRKTWQGLMRLAYNGVVSTAASSSSSSSSSSLALDQSSTTTTTHARSELDRRRPVLLATLCGRAYHALGVALSHDTLSSSLQLTPTQSGGHSSNRSSSSSSNNHTTHVVNQGRRGCDDDGQWAFVPVSPPSLEHVDAANASTRSAACRTEPDELPLFVQPSWQPPRAASTTSTVPPKRASRLVLSSRSSNSTSGTDATVPDGENHRITITTRSKGQAANGSNRSSTLSSSSSASSSSSLLLTAQQVWSMGIVATLTLARLESDSSTTTLYDRLAYTLGTVARAWLRTAAATTTVAVVPVAKHQPAHGTTADTTTTTSTNNVVVDDGTILSASTVASHAKAAQRILWNAATNNPNLDPVDCLRLQQLAIELYLLIWPSTSKQDSTVVLSAAVISKLLQSHFATACTMAWKASESFLLGSAAAAADGRASSATTLRGDSTKRFDVVSAFHARLGPHLDRMAAAAAGGDNTDKEEPPVVPGSYFEYCAYRALHSSRCRMDHGPSLPLDSHTNLARHCNHGAAGCVFSRFPFPCPHHLCFCSGSATAVPTSTTTSTASVALVYLALTVRNGLEALLQQTSSADPKRTVAAREAAASPWPVSQADTVQFNFQQLLKSTATVVEDVGTFGGLRLYKVLSALSLHKMLQAFVSRQSDRRLVWQPFSWALCRTAATLLADCVGPLCFRLSTVVEGTQRMSVASVGVASLRSAIALSELLHNEAALDSSLVSTTNRWMGDLVHQLTFQQRQRSVELTETTARVRHHS